MILNLLYHSIELQVQIRYSRDSQLTLFFFYFIFLFIFSSPPFFLLGLHKVLMKQAMTRFSGRLDETRRCLLAELGLRSPRLVWLVLSYLQDGYYIHTETVYIGSQIQFLLKICYSLFLHLLDDSKE